jgi:hypothetical protein
MPAQFLDASKALEHLKTYERGDGLSVRELMDSKRNGGLTYNVRSLVPISTREDEADNSPFPLSQDFLVYASLRSFFS